MEISKVLVLDLGGNITQYLARKIREKGVFSEIIPAASTFEYIIAEKPQALIICGGPEKTESEVIAMIDSRLFKLSLPILGLGYGTIPLVNYYGGKADPIKLEDDKNSTTLVYSCNTEIFGATSSGSFTPVWMAPIQISRKPESSEVTSHTAEQTSTSLSFLKNQLHTISFLPPDDILDSFLDYFLFRVAKLDNNWSPAAIIESTVNKIAQSVEINERAVCGLSGGIDSAVSALIVQKALGNRLTAIFVDHGLLRQGEADEVINIFKNKFSINLIQVNASEEFLNLLQSIEDPEIKRHVIGNHFIKIFEREASKLNNVKYLVQGTIYPDVVESMTPSGHIIKSHHNVGGLPERMNLKLIEPVRALFKDEVREVGKAMGLPDEIVWRHPFPGPGLAVRVLGKITKERLEITRQANAIVEDEIKKEGLYRDIWQVFAVVPEMRSVGVSGDRRTYAYPVIIRAVKSRDAMTAEWYQFSFKFLDRVSKRLVEEIAQVNRVAYDITSKPPATIEWE